jgi:glycosyltransferase involved in cell wall biosynthesis
MHVCVVSRFAGAALNGVSTHVQCLVNSLTNKGVEVSVFAVDIEPGRKCAVNYHWMRPFLENRNPFNPRNTLLPLASLVKKLFVLQRQKPIQIFHVHDVFAFYAVSLVARLYAIPTAFTIHSMTIAKPDLALYPQHTKYMGLQATRFVLKNAHAVIAVSRDLLPILIKLGAKADRLEVIENFVDLDRFSTPVPGSDDQFSSDADICLFVGSFIEVKGLEWLIRAVPQMVKRRPKLIVVLAGGGDLEEKLRQMVSDLGLGSHVRFLGIVKHEDIHKWYQRAKMLVLPSLSEAKPMVILEAFAAGLPVVASDVGGIPEVVRHGWNGLLVEPRDEEGLAHAVCSLFDDNAFLQQCSKNALDTASQLSCERGIMQVLTLYERITRN